LSRTVFEKRYDARLRRFGRCSVCQFREVTDGTYHCKRNPDRQGACVIDGRLPKFQFDSSSVEDLRDAK